MSRMYPLRAACALVVMSISASVAVWPQTPEEGEKWRADLRLLALEMPKLHKNLFHTVTREQFENKVREIEARLPRLRRHEFIVEVMKLVALVGGGYTSIHPGFDPQLGFHTFPLTLYAFKDGLYVRSAAPDYVEAVGGRVVRLGNASAEDAFAAVSSVVSRDNAMTLKARTPYFMMIPEVLHALGLSDATDKATMVLEKDNRRLEIELKRPEPIATMFHGPPKQAQAQVDARGAGAPLWLKKPETEHYWFEYVADARTVYVQYNAVANKHDESIAAFFRRVFEFVNTHEVERFVLDVRRNSGGNSFLNLPIVLGLIKAEKINQRGRLFTIIGRGTFSAAQNLVNELEKYTNTLFVGEPTGSRPNQYGDHETIRLPNSRISVFVSTLWHQMNARDEREWTRPHLDAEPGFADYRANRDPAWEAIRQYGSLSAELASAIGTGDKEEIIRRYRAYRSNPQTAAFDTETEINALGYQLMNAGKPQLAVEIFKLNVESHPQSWNAWDSLGEAYQKSGDKAQALKSYGRAMELNPHNGFLRQRVRALSN